VDPVRNFSRRQALLGSAAVVAAPALALSVQGSFAQATWPNKPVRVFVPYPPGGGADTVGRIYFNKLSEKLGQQFVIDNRGGAGGTIGAAAALKGGNDGYTILYDATAHSINPFLYPKLPYDTGKDFEAVYLASLVPNILVVHPSVEAKTLDDVIRIAKATPEGLAWASSGNGTVQHLSLELFRQQAGVKLNHVPYRGGGPALADVMGGQVKFFFSNGSASIGHVLNGSVKAIVHTGRGRLGNLPNVPAASETLPGFETYEWNGVFFPAGVAPELVQKLNAALNEVRKDPDVVDRLKKLNVETRANTPADFRAFINAELERWSRVIKEGGIKLGN
jgi:tripartite-type tricarboxylate transporter receptor subunit TctC